MLRLFLREGSMNKLIRKYKLMKTANGFPGSEKKKLDFCFEKITGRPG